MRVLLACLLIALTAAAQAANATYAGRKAWIIKGAGTTTATIRLGGEMLTVAIHAWQVPVNADAEDAPHPYTQCTYSQNPCSITDWIHVRLGGKTIWVGSFAIAGMGDMHYLSVSGTPSRFVLYIGGGDAAGAYDARLIFKRQTLVERILYGLDSKRPFEVSRYYAEDIN